MASKATRIGKRNPTTKIERFYMDIKAKHIIPVIIHHETGAKSQSGGGKHQEYLRYCIEQTAKYNEKTVLIGDEYNREWCKEWHHVNEFPSRRFDLFKDVFRNLSTYPDSWAVSFFKRFFLIHEYLVQNSYSDCVILDSDILLYMNLSEYTPFASCDTALEIPKNQDLAGAPAGNGLRWTACAGISYFTKEALSNFLDYCIDMYTNHSDILNQKWEAHQKYNLYGGVGEMSLLYLWTKTLPKDRVLNLAKVYKDSVFDANMCISSNYLENEFAYDPLLRIKKLDWIDGRPYCKRLSDQRPVFFCALHFGDISKQYMYDFFTYQKITFPVRLKAFFWYMRSILASIKHGDFHPFHK